MAEGGSDCRPIPVTPDGTVEPGAVRQIPGRAPNSALVSVAAANSEAGEKDLCRRVGDDGRRIRPPEAFLGALAADALERDGWTKYVATTLADTPPGDWADEDGKMFHARLKGAPAKSRRLAGLHFAQVSESFAKRPGKFTAAYADGKEHGCVVPADSNKRKRVEKIADKLDSTGRRNVGRQLGSHLVCLESQVEEMAVALVFGIDVSGCPESGNYKYMAVFICTEEFLNVVVRRLQLNTVGAGSAPRKKTENPYLTLSSLIHANVLLCIKTERKKILQIVESPAKADASNLRTNKIRYAYHQAVWRSVRGRIADFLKQHKQDFDDAVFESDGDCVNFLKDVAVRRTEPSYAHMMADAIAWANNANKAPKGVIEIDATGQIVTALRK